MAKQRHLKNAPVSEAVIDFRVKTTPDIGAEAIKPVLESIKGVYPKCDEMRAFQWELSYDAKNKEAAGSQKDIGLIGYRMESACGKNIGQFRVNGFTFSRLAPYTKWEEVFLEAQELWKVYEGAVDVIEIVRIAVRYINRMQFPIVEVGNFSPYLAAPPPIPNELNVALTNFSTKLEVLDQKSGASGTVIQSIQQESTNDEVVTVVLDIDVYDNKSYLVDDMDKIFTRFQALRDFKNDLFFKSITKEAAKLFE